MKLLPCPFCGGEPEEYGGMFFEFYGHERQDYSIACKKCRAEVRCDVGEHEGADAPCSCHHDTRKICAEKWNRRAAMLQGAEHNRPDAVDANLVEALRLVQCMLEDYRERNYGDAERWIRHIDTHMSDYSETHGDDAYSILHDLLPAAPQREDL